MKNEQTEEKQRNDIIIADGDLAIYYRVFVNLAQVNDRFELYCMDRYLPKTLDFIKSLEALGIFTLDSINGKLMTIEKIDKDLENEQGKYKKSVNKIILSKHPVLYRFTKG
jgi:hypothetical protein